LPDCYITLPRKPRGNNDAQISMRKFPSLPCRRVYSSPTKPPDASHTPAFSHTCVLLILYGMWYVSFEVKHRYMLVCSYSSSARVAYPLRRSRRLIRCSILLQDTHYRHACTRHTTHKPRRSLCLVGWGEACAYTWRFPGDLRKGRLPHIAKFEFGSDVIQRRGVSAISFFLFFRFEFDLWRSVLSPWVQSLCAEMIAALLSWCICDVVTVACIPRGLCVMYT
jgi:hypothetical protein